jgi:hypothetical protein
MVVVNIIIVIMLVTEKRKQEDLFKSLATSCCLCGNPKKQQHEPKEKKHRGRHKERENQREKLGIQRGGVEDSVEYLYRDDGENKMKDLLMPWWREGERKRI